MQNGCHLLPGTDAVTSDEIRRLGLRFEKLDRDKSGSISIEEFMALPEIKKNPMASRVISIFDVDKNGQVDFKGQPKWLPVYLYPCPSTLSAGMLILVLVLKDSLRTFFKSLSLSWSL